MLRPVVLYDLADDFCVLCSQFWLTSLSTLGIFRRYAHDAFGAGKDLCPSATIFCMNCFDCNVSSIG